MINRSRKALQKCIERGSVIGVKGRDTLCSDCERCLLEALWVAPGENDAGSLGTGSPGSFESDAGAAADDDNRLAEQIGLASRNSDLDFSSHDLTTSWLRSLAQMRSPCGSSREPDQDRPNPEHRQPLLAHENKRPPKDAVRLKYVTAAA
jgi:hypothetical protein